MADHSSKKIDRSVALLTRAVSRLVDTVSRIAAAPARGRAGSRGGYRPLSPAKAKLRSQRLKKRLKASWAAYTPKQRAERIRKMLAGRGLKPKAKA
jgi:hypothetical protein